MRDEFLVDEVEYKGYTIRIYQDDDPGIADMIMDDDRFGTMNCLHKRYNIGDDHDFSAKELMEYVEEENVHALPIYMLDHSGITISTAPFSCPWDSGQLGYIYCTNEDIEKEYGQVSPETVEKAMNLMKSEVERYDAVLRGEIFLFMTEDDDGEVIDSCGGFVGIDEMDHLKTEAKQAIDCHIKTREQKREQKLKSLIENKVPYDKREQILSHY